MLHLGGQSKASQPPIAPGIALTPLNNSFRGDPYAVLSRLRPEAPVLEDKALKRFIYSRHERLLG